MKRTILALILALWLVAPVNSQTTTKVNSPARRAADNITAAQMKDYLSFIASDEMEGRDTPSRGLNTTAKFIATMLSRWNVKPAGDDGYFQKIVLRGTVPDADKSSLEINGQKFNLGDDVLRIAGMSETALSAPLVYGGDGWLIKSKNIDALAGVDIKGKIVVLYGNGMPSGFTLTPLPNGTARQDLTGQRGTDWADPATYARSKGAAGIIVIASDGAQSKWSAVKDFYSRGRFVVDKLTPATAPDNFAFPVIFVSQKVANTLFTGESVNPLQAGMSTGGSAAFEMSANKKVSLTVATKTETVMTQNVVGIIEGSDPVLKSEVVALGAHYDHIGMNPLASGDQINNGADDDGSGTTAILSIAEALSKAPKKPKRSVLFVWHCGEEKGLWGSDYFTSFPTVPLEKVVTQLNIDMIGRTKKTGDTNPLNKELSGANEIYVIGSKMMSAQLGSLSEAVNNSYLKLTFDYRYDAPNDPNNFYGRSDHYNYAKKGVPIIFYFDGVHEDYHRPGDEVSKIDFDKMQRVTRTVFLTMWELSDLKARPVIDKQLPAERMKR
ncbi:MAG: M28 family peptidase [Pyrinomonadaceae bacterium]